VTQTSTVGPLPAYSASQIAVNSLNAQEWLDTVRPNGSALTLPHEFPLAQMPLRTHQRYSATNNMALDSNLFLAFPTVPLFDAGTSLAPGALNFSVTVTNVFGQSSTAHAAVTRLQPTVAVPKVVLPIMGLYSISRGEVLFLEASIEFSACMSTRLGSAVVWRWSEESGEALDARSRNSSTLRFASDQLLPGSTYHLLATARMAHNPMLIGYATADVYVSFAGARAALTTAGPSSISAQHPIVLDASGSFDLDATPPPPGDDPAPLGYSWRWLKYGAAATDPCETVSEDAARAAQSALGRGGAVLTMPPGVMAPDQRCEFRVDVLGVSPTTVPGSSATQVITVVPADVLPPDVRVGRLRPPPTQPVVTAALENTVLEGQLQAVAQVDTGRSYDVGSACSWQLVDGVLPAAIDSYRRRINADTSRLILPAGTLTAGQAYYFRFSCFINGHEGFSDLRLQTNTAPTLGVLEIFALDPLVSGKRTQLLPPLMAITTTSRGFASDLLVRIELQTRAWVDDPADNPLTYSFQLQRLCAAYHTDCVGGHTYPVTLGSGTAAKLVSKIWRAELTSDAGGGGAAPLLLSTTTCRAGRETAPRRSVATTLSVRFVCPPTLATVAVRVAAVPEPSVTGYV
jgi:hypothetical protein